MNAGFQYPDVSGGAIQLTGNPLDVAIVGDGYFAVQTPQGERYTRAGALTTDATGRLVTMEGQPILSRTGPITIAPEERSLTIAADGTISSRQRILAAFASFGSTALFKRWGLTYFRARLLPSIFRRGP